MKRCTHCNANYDEAFYSICPFCGIAEKMCLDCAQRICKETIRKYPDTELCRECIND